MAKFARETDEQIVQTVFAQLIRYDTLSSPQETRAKRQLSSSRNLRESHDGGDPRGYHSIDAVRYAMMENVLRG